MGGYQSKLTSEEVEELQSSTHFTSREIEVLYSRFKKLDRKRAGYITSQEFYLIPELSMNPLCDRIIAMFDPDKTEQVTFDMFVQTVNLFSSKTPWPDRMKAVFQVYDVNEDGTISSDDLLAILRMLVGDNIADEVLQAIVHQTLSECGRAPDGHISQKQLQDIIGADVAQLTMQLRTSD